MKTNFKPALVALITVLFSTAGLAETNWGKYQITITNLTRGQGFSPLVIAIQSGDYPLFVLGSPASPGIAAIAEDGVQATLAEEIKAKNPNAKLVLARAPIPPGKSASYEVTGGMGAKLSLASMLGATNDAFFALNSVNFSTGTYYAVAYDSGSEANNESCAYVPGGPCSAHNVRMPNGSEGYVHVHAGIKGIADLDERVLDWRNPVAKIVVKRLR